MHTKQPRKHLMLVAAFVAVLAALPVFAADGDKSTVKGLITAIQGDTITIRDDNNTDHTINVSPDTVYKKKVGVAALRFETVEKSALMPGLPIIADVVAAGDGYTATAISFKSEDFRTAQQVQAGLVPTETELAATKTRMDEFGTYEALDTVEVMFASGKTAISATGKSDLMALAGKTKDLKDYRVVVQGFTDSTGDPATNQKLSAARAQAVTEFLQEQAGLSPGRVQEGDGMGVAADAGAGSNASARKVVVKLVVDKGVNAAD